MTIFRCFLALFRPATERRGLWGRSYEKDLLFRDPLRGSQIYVVKILGNFSHS